MGDVSGRNVGKMISEPKLFGFRVIAAAKWASLPKYSRTILKWKESESERESEERE